MKIFTFWLPKVKGTDVYNKNGYSYCIHTYTKKLERLENNGAGLQCIDYLQITQKEHGKKEVVEESSNIFQKLMYCAFDESGNYDGILDTSSITEDEGSKDTPKKDGFVEFLNTITYYEDSKIPKLKIMNNRQDYNDQKSENKII